MCSSSCESATSWLAPQRTNTPWLLQAHTHCPVNTAAREKNSLIPATLVYPGPGPDHTRVPGKFRSRAYRDRGIPRTLRREVSHIQYFIMQPTTYHIVVDRSKSLLRPRGSPGPQYPKGLLEIPVKLYLPWVRCGLHPVRIALVVRSLL